jgi:enoyl-CoA hydratase
MSTPIETERHSDGVATLWLSRTERRNAIDSTLIAALIEAVEAVPDAVIVLGSRDPRAFSAGADLTLGDDERAAVSDRLYELYRLLVTRRAPVIAAIGGAAVGGGAQIAIAADLRVMSRSATLRFVGPGHGLAVGGWGLPSLVGRGRALDLCLTMRPVSAAEALAMGLADRICDDPLADALEIASALARLDAGAVARVREVVYETFGIINALDRERRGNFDTWSGSVEGLA